MSIRSGKGLPLRDVNNSWPFGPAMLETLPYLLGLFFFGSSLVASRCRRIRASKSLTNHQRTNRRRQHQLNSMSMSQDKGARPISAIHTTANGDRSEGERAGGPPCRGGGMGERREETRSAGSIPLHSRSDAEWRLYKIAHRSQKFPPSPLRRYCLARLRHPSARQWRIGGDRWNGQLQAPGSRRRHFVHHRRSRQELRLRLRPGRGHQAVSRPRQNEGKGQKSVKTRAPLASYRSGSRRLPPMFPTARHSNGDRAVGGHMVPENATLAPDVIERVHLRSTPFPNSSP